MERFSNQFGSSWPPQQPKFGGLGGAGRVGVPHGGVGIQGGLDKQRDIETLKKIYPFLYKELMKKEEQAKNVLSEQYFAMNAQKHALHGDFEEISEEDEDDYDSESEYEDGGVAGRNRKRNSRSMKPRLTARESEDENSFSKNLKSGRKRKQSQTFKEKSKLSGIEDPEAVNLSSPRVGEEQELEFMRELKDKQKEIFQGRFVVHGEKVFYSKTSLFLFDQNSKFRFFFVWLVKWRPFEQFIILSILANSICLLLFDYSDRQSLTQYNKIMNTISDVFTVLFLCEAAFKVIAMGFVLHRFSYLREIWNLLDFIIVISGVIDFVSTSVNLKALRILRTIRPLRTLKAIPSMRRQVSTFLRSLPEIGNTAVFLLFVITLLSILGVQQFQGVLYYRCRETPAPINSTYWPKSESFTRVCSFGQENQGAYQCPAELTCGSPEQYGISLDDDGVYKDEMLEYGLGNFDHFGQSFIAMIQVSTAEDWSRIMYNLSDGRDFTFTQIYFCFIVILNHFYMTKLLLAVIVSNLSSIQADEAYKEVRSRKSKLKAASSKQLPQIGGGATTEQPLNSEEISPAKIMQSSSPEKLGEEDGNFGGPGALIDPNTARELDDELSVLKFQSDCGDVEASSIGSEMRSSNHSPKFTQNEQGFLTTENNLIDKLKANHKKKVKESTGSHNLESQFRDQMMWRIGLKKGGSAQAGESPGAGGVEGQETAKNKEIIRGLGLAILNKVLNFKKLENQYQRDVDRIKKISMIKDPELRLKLQRKIADKVSLMREEIDLGVREKYMISKKNVYGIDNELHLVEQVQKCMKLVFEPILPGTHLFTVETIEERFNDIVQRETGVGKAPIKINPETTQLDLQLHLSLNLALNLQEITLTTNVKDFFFTRFKRQLIQRNTINNVHESLQTSIVGTEIELRNRANLVFRACYHFQRSGAFQLMQTLAVAGNAIVLALSRYPNEDQYERTLERLNIGFFGFFLFELIIKILGMGFKHYAADPFNIFDGGVILLSAIDIVLQTTLQNRGRSGAITALRVLRVLRMVRLAKTFKELGQLFQTIKQTLVDVSNISVLLTIFMASFALLGMELFAYKVHQVEDPESYPESNFNGPLNAILSVIVVLANDGWAKIYETHYRGTDPASASLFFFSLLVIGQFILLNLFVAVLIDIFEEQSVKNDLIRKIEQAKQKPLWDTIKKTVCICRSGTVKVKSEGSEEGPFRPSLFFGDEAQKRQLEEEQRLAQSSALNILAYTNPLRKFLKKLVEHKYFETVMLAVILTSNIQLAIDSPLNDPDSLFSQVLNYVDYSVTAIFALEVVLKVLTFGLLFCGSQSYLRSSWNLLDLAIVVVTGISYLVDTRNIGAVKALRTLKVLRPLRLISRNPGLRISIAALGVALNGLWNIVLVSLLFYFIFGIIAINYFQGILFYCAVESGTNVDTKWDCLNSGGTWRNSYFNFDNILEAMSANFIISNAVQWQDIMYRTQRARGLDLAPTPDLLNNQLNCLYFICVVIIGNFFLMNLFIGAIISSYNREREIIGKDFLISDKQNQWLRNQLMTLSAEPKFRMRIPHNEWRQPFYYIGESWQLRVFIMSCIAANTLVLALQWYGQPQGLNQALDLVNYIFLGVFVVEFLIKYIGFGNRYFADGWQLFDATILGLTLIGVVLSQYTSMNLGPQTTVIRSFRIARIFTLLRQNRGLKTSFNTFVMAIPAMANVGSLIMLVILIFAILGVQLFSEVQLNGALDAHANFQNIGKAFVTLIRVATGEQWPSLMEALSREQPEIDYQCIPNPSYSDYSAHNFQPAGCGSQFFAKTYFFSFVLLVDMIFMRLFIAIILQTFKKAQDKENKFMNSRLSDQFRDVWSLFDPDGTSFIKTSVFPKFMLQLGEPLGWDFSFHNNYLKQKEYLKSTEMPVHNHGSDYMFGEVFEHLILLMIIRREVINYAIRHRRFELIGWNNQEKILTKRPLNETRKSRKNRKKANMVAKTDPRKSEQIEILDDDDQPEVAVPVKTVIIRKKSSAIEFTPGELRQSFETDKAKTKAAHHQLHIDTDDGNLLQTNENFEGDGHVNRPTEYMENLQSPNFDTNGHFLIKSESSVEVVPITKQEESPAVPVKMAGGGGTSNTVNIEEIKRNLQMVEEELGKIDLNQIPTRNNSGLELGLGLGFGLAMGLSHRQQINQQTPSSIGGNGPRHTIVNTNPAHFEQMNMQSGGGHADYN